MLYRIFNLVLAISVFSAPTLVVAEDVCGDQGVWIQTLGAGGPELDDGQAGASHLIWVDGKARVLIDAGPGSSVGFDQSNANIEDLYAIAFTHLHADNTADFPAFINGSSFADRTEPLVVLGPDSKNPDYPDTETFINRLIGPDGAYPYLQDFLTHRSSGGYRVRARNVPATGKKRWAGFGNDELRIAAIPVNHGSVPALAWQVRVGDQTIVVAGDFNNLKNVMPKFAKDADVLVVNHAIPEDARGNHRERHVLPSQIGRIAAQAEARMVILAHRMNRTRGKESLSRQAIEEHYDGYIIFANDLECWGL